MVTLGIDRIEEYRSLFAGRRIGLVTNFSGVDSCLREDLDVFAAAGLSVVRLFTPEHGLYGVGDGESVADSEHPKYHIPILSLYGDKVQPDPADLDGLDVLVYDIQDVGLRYYTYIYTLANCMKTAAEVQLPVVVLDRPDPLGDAVGGNRIAPEHSSFVGDHALPIRYGLTIGELGAYFRRHLKLDLDYSVIPMEGYAGDMRWPETGQLWNLPSPAIHTFQTVLCYYGGCFFEATNLSEGRGTAEPFQIYGAPFIDMDRLADALRDGIPKEHLAMRTRAFLPASSKYKGEICYGVEFIPLDEDLDFLPVSLFTMKTIRDLYPDEFQFRSYADVTGLARLTGDASADGYLDGRVTLPELMADWSAQSASFKRETEDLRIYR